MQNALDTLMAVIPVDVNALRAAVSEYEMLHEKIRGFFEKFKIKAEDFTNEVICFLTACDLYGKEEFDKLLSLWNQHISDLLQVDVIKRYYLFLLNDAKTLYVSDHFLKRIDSLKIEYE